MTFASQLWTAFSPITAVYDPDSVRRSMSWAQSMVTSYCGQDFDLITGTVAQLDPKPYRCALLDQVPVVNVSLVEGLLPPVASTGSGLQWTTLTNYRWVGETGLIYDTSGEPNATFSVGCQWPWVPGGLRVTYDHGYALIPQPLIDVACRLANQYLDNPAGLLQRRVGEVEARFAGSAGMVINELDKRVLDRYSDIGIA